MHSATIQRRHSGRGLQALITSICIVLCLAASVPAQPLAGAPDQRQLEFYKDYTLITTNCTNWQDAYALVRAITARGGIVSVILTPNHLLGWVPPELRDEVRGIAKVGTLYSAPPMAKLSVAPEYEQDLSAALEHFRKAKSGLLDLAPAENAPPAPCIDDASRNPLVSFVEHLGRVEDSTAAARGESLQSWRGPIKDSVMSLIGLPPGVMTGILNADVFMTESDGAPSAYNWTIAEENTVVQRFLQSFDFWTRNAASYGRSVTFRGSWYRPSSTTVVRVSREPIRTAKSDDWRIVKQVLERCGYTEPWGSTAGSWIGAILTLGACIPCDLAIAFDLMDDGETKEFIRCMKWNDKRAGDLGVDQSYCGFVKLLPAGAPETHRAYAKIVSTGFIGGSFTIPVINLTITANICIGPYFMVDSQDGAAVEAHETGHLFGAPDEYQENAGDPDCAQPGFRFRNCSNPNCEATNPSSVTAMMRNNNSNNYNYDQISSATPIHLGWVGGVPRTIRFRTEPSGISMTLPIGVTSGETFTTTKDFHMGLGYRIMGASVPASQRVGGVDYFFEGWYDGGTRVTEGTRRNITIDSRVSEYVARYTRGGGGVTAENNTLEARLGVGPPSAAPPREFYPSVVLVWNSTLTEMGATYRAQYRDGGTWTDVPRGYYFVVNNEPGLCYANITHAPGRLASGATYRFRMVPMTRAGADGTPTNEVTVPIRSSMPSSGTFCYDANEPNDAAATATTFTSAEGTRDSTYSASIHYTQPGEFGYAFDTDVYRIIVRDFGLGANEARVRFAVKPGSLFLPSVHWRPSTSTTMREARLARDNSATVIFSDEGEYIVSITAKRSNYDLIDFESAASHYGEYTMTLTRDFATSMLGSLCRGCYGSQIAPIGGGLVYPADRLGRDARYFTMEGMTITAPLVLGILGVPDPGWEFLAWEGSFPGKSNPLSISLDPGKTPPGESMILGTFTKLPAGTVELVYEVPRAYESVLGPTQRYRGTIGEEFDVGIPDAALNGFEFLGWDGTVQEKDIVAPEDWRMSPRLRIKLSRDCWIRPLLRPRPCEQTQMQPFTQTITITNALQAGETLTYGMQPGAGDGLEAGQTELPPVPPSGVQDYRFLNIAGAPQGCLFDIRAVKPAHVYAGRVQPGDKGNPVTFAWNPIPAAIPAAFVLRIGAATVNMRAQTSFTTDVGVSSSFMIEVTQDTCRELPKNEITVEISDVDPSGYPYVRGRLCVKDKQGNPVLTLRPADVLLMSQAGQGNPIPGHLRSMRPSHGCYEFEVILPDTLARTPGNNSRGLVLVVQGADPPGQTGKIETFTVPTPDPGTDTINGNGRPNTSCRIAHGAGWQMLSLPYQLPDQRVFAVYGETSSPLYRFNPDAGYEASDALEFGRGYWLRFSGAGERTLNGIERTVFEYKNLPGVGQSAANGWNMIGGISYDVPRSAIVETPGGAILSLFEFSGGYRAATTLKAGAGFWVKLQQNATLRVVKPFRGESGGGISKTAFASLPYERVIDGLPRVRNWNVNDANGASAALFTTTNAGYIALGFDDIEATELPPLPPTGSFDARMENERVFAPDGETTRLLLQGAWPLHLETEAVRGSTARYIITDGDGVPLGSIDGAAGGTVMIPAPATGTRARLQIRRLAGDDKAAPTAAFIGSFYPNPIVAGGRPASLAYEAAGQCDVSISVHDALGRVLRVLADGPRAPGRYMAVWDGTDEFGRVMPSGTYFCTIQLGELRVSRRVTIAR